MSGRTNVPKGSWYYEVYKKEEDALSDQIASFTLFYLLLVISSFP